MEIKTRCSISMRKIRKRNKQETKCYEQNADADADADAECLSSAFFFVVEELECLKHTRMFLR